MILDCGIDATTLVPLVAIYDAETGEEVERHADLMYIDTDRGVYRLAARDGDGDLIRDAEGEITWTEHPRRFRIEPHPRLDPDMRESVAREIERRQREGLPSFEDRPPTTLDDAMHEVKVEDACRGLGLDDSMTEKVIQSYRFSPSLLHTILEHDGDHATYVRVKLEIMKRLGIN
jgi:hypothetical protein